MEQKVVITRDQSEINGYLQKGWIVVSVTAQNINYGGNQYERQPLGNFCFLLERNIY